MQKNEKILKRQSTKIFFDNDDTDFFFNWMLGVAELFGMSHGELFYLAHKIGRDGKPSKWRSCFTDHADYLVRSAKAATGEQMAVDCYFGATYAYRAVLQFADPFSPEYPKLVGAMEDAFAGAAKAIDIPIKSVRVPYQTGYLPGYYLHCDSKRPTVVMVGGGDTYREDLFYFAGWPGWRRNYNVLMVDLPGQGSNPTRGLTFTVDAGEPIAACLGWLQTENPDARHIALYGVSGGGYFTAQAAAKDIRISAWIASTPIFDVAELFRREFGAALKAPGWLMNLALKLAGNINEVADINLKNTLGSSARATSVRRSMKFSNRQRLSITKLSPVRRCFSWGRAKVLNSGGKRNVSTTNLSGADLIRRCMSSIRKAVLTLIVS